MKVSTYTYRPTPTREEEMPKAKMHTAIYSGEKHSLSINQWAILLQKPGTYFRDRLSSKRNMTMQQIVDEFMEAKRKGYEYVKEMAESRKHSLSFLYKGSPNTNHLQENTHAKSY